MIVLKQTKGAEYVAQSLIHDENKHWLKNKDSNLIIKN